MTWYSIALLRVRLNRAYIAPGNSGDNLFILKNNNNLKTFTSAFLIFIGVSLTYTF